MTEQGDLREKLSKSILDAFNRWSAQNWDILVDPNKRRENPELLENARLDDLFMSKRVYIPGFFRYVTKQVRESEDCQRQLRTLVKTAILSLLRPSGVSVGELEKKAGAGDSYTRRNLQNFFKQYTQAFYEVEGERGADRRLVQRSSVFSPFNEPTLDNPIAVKKVQLKDMAAMESRPDLKEWIKLNATLQVVLPEVLEDLAEFQRLCHDLLMEIADYSEMGEILADELSGITPVLEVFHNHVLSIMSIGWFRGRRQNTKKALIHDGFPFKYTEEDGGSATSLLLQWNSEEDAANIVLNAAHALQEYGLPDASGYLYNQCLKLPSLSPWYKGLFHENIAVLYRNNPNPRLMVQEMKMAVDCYKEAGETYRVCVALKNLGEAEWMLGYPETAGTYFAEAEKLSETLGRPERANVFMNLYAAAMRLRQEKLQVKYLMRFLEFAPEDWTERIVKASARLGELTRR